VERFSGWISAFQSADRGRKDSWDCRNWFMSFVWFIEFVSFIGLSDQKTKETQNQMNQTNQRH
jgi:hypothetical protein